MPGSIDEILGWYHDSLAQASTKDLRYKNDPLVQNLDLINHYYFPINQSLSLR
jgi:hypothetical protein